MQAEYGQEEIERLVGLALSESELTNIELRNLFIKFKSGIRELQDLKL